MKRKRKIKVHIIGAGAIGSALAAQLSLEGCEVTVVDTDEFVLQNISNTLDVFCYQGNGASYATLQEIHTAEADVCIAVTDSDELNILACLTAHILGAKHTVARVRDVDYAKQANFYRDKLGLSFTINPELAAAQEITRVLRFPSATRVEVFAKGRAELVEVVLKAQSPMCGLSLLDIGQKYKLNALICAVVRDDEVFIPKGDFVLQVGDVLYLTGSPDSFHKTLREMNMPTKPVRNVLIAGAGRISYYLASVLQHSNLHLTLVEKNHQTAVEFCRAFPACSIMNDDAIHYFDTMSETDVKNTDAFIALTDNNEYNVVASMYAASKGINKVVSRLRGDTKMKLLQKSDRISTISQEDTAVDIILSYTRSLMNADEMDAVESLSRLMDGRIEVSEFRVPDNFPYFELPLHQLNIRSNTLIACLMRGQKAIAPRGNDTIQRGDRILVATLHTQISSLEDVFLPSRTTEV